jgi:predicted DNA-binding WGR domain protein
MTATYSDISLYRVEPSKNMSRYYTLSVQPNLFGGFSLLRNWGRIGTGGQIRVDFFEDEDVAISASEQLAGSKLKRGYLTA